MKDEKFFENNCFILFSLVKMGNKQFWLCQNCLGGGEIIEEQLDDGTKKCSLCGRKYDFFHKTYIN